MPVDPNYVDGDKLIAFINALKDLGTMLEQANVLGVKDAFLVGKSMGCVERVIEQRDKWRRCLAECAEAMKSEIAGIDQAKQNGRHIVEFLQLVRKLGYSDEARAGLEHLKELAEVCDRLERHRNSGILGLVAEMSVKRSENCGG